MSSVFSSQDQFCPFWDQFCGFAYIIRLGDHFCLGITFAVVHAPFPEVCGLYLSEPVVSSNDTKMDENDTQTLNCSRWALMSSLSSALSNHIAFHKLPSNKQGVLLYRKGSDVLASLHNVLYRERLRLKNWTETEGLHSLNLSMSEEAMILNNL